MYPDPKRIREHRVTLRLDHYEHELLAALAKYQGEQMSTLMRELALREAEQTLATQGVLERRARPAR